MLFVHFFEYFESSMSCLGSWFMLASFINTQYTKELKRRKPNRRQRRTQAIVFLNSDMNEFMYPRHEYKCEHSGHQKKL